MKKFLLISLLLIVFGIFCATRFNQLNLVRPDEDTFSWLYRINYYPWIVSSNLKGQNLGDRDLKYAGTISYHPGVTIMTFSGISTKIGKAIKEKGDPLYESCPYLDFNCKYLDYELFIAKLPLVLIIGILFVFSIYMFSVVFSMRQLFIWIAIMLFEPILISSSQQLHLDFLFGMFVIAGVSAILYSIKSEKKLVMVLAGALMGFALLTRFAGVFFIPGILASLLYIDAKNFIKNVLYFALGGFAAFIGFYPPMWVAPIETLTYIIKSSAEISDNLAGVIPAHIKYWNNLVWYWGIYSVALSIYIWFVLVSGIIAIFALPSRNKRLALAILIIYISYFSFVNLADKQYVRYLIPVLIGISVPTSIGVWNLFVKALKLLSRAKMYTWLLNSR